MKTMLEKIQTCFRCLLLLVTLAAVALPAPVRADRSDLPLAVRVVISKAGALVKQQKYDQAVAVLTAYQGRSQGTPIGRASDPNGYDHPELYFALGTCHLLNQAYGPAAEAFEQAVRRDPGHVKAWLNLAKAAYELNDYARAARCFRQAYDQEAAKKPEYLYYSAVAFLMASRTEPCLDAFELLFKTHGEAVQPAWRENYVSALLTAGRSRQALPHIRALAEQLTGEKQVQWQEILLNQYLQLNMKPQARDYALFLTRQDPLRAKWWKALVHVALQENRYEQALTAMMIYSYLTPLKAEESKLLADLNLQLGIPAKAVPLYEAVLAENPDGRLVRSLVLALQQLGKTEQAVAALDRFHASDKGRHGELAMLRADLLYTLERYEEAAGAYRQAASRDSSHAGRAWLMAGYAALQSGDSGAGRQAFEKAATFRSQRRAARLALQQLPETGGRQPGRRSRI